MTLTVILYAFDLLELNGKDHRGTSPAGKGFMEV
jgi:hypothetical protein